ncbi:MAG TPA: AMIN domain-containing protein, partial [Enhygromyxa sp.]|nr:AMIN domain-containing protein [Enhygromyxa sp.]
MRRRRLVVTPPTVALVLIAGTAWAGPPPPPPTEGGPPPSSGGRVEATPADPLVIDQRTPDTDLTGAWTYSRGAVQGPNYVREAQDDPFFSVNPVGYYQGVSLGGGNLPPFAPKEIGGESAVLTWTGFERGDNSSRVFVQLSAAVEPELSVEGARVFVKLPRTSVKIKNNRRSLITKYFKTPVNEVKINRAGKDVLVVLELRWEATPSWRFEIGQNGYQVLVIEFPDAPVDGSRPPTPPTPPIS